MLLLGAVVEGWRTQLRRSFDFAVLYPPPYARYEIETSRKLDTSFADNLDSHSSYLQCFVWSNVSSINTL